MSAQEGHGQDAAVSLHEARVHCLERVLRRYGTLTPARLYEFSGAHSWASDEPFDEVLDEAVRSGRVERLGGVLLSATIAERH